MRMLRVSSLSLAMPEHACLSRYTGAVDTPMCKLSVKVTSLHRLTQALSVRGRRRTRECCCILRTGTCFFSMLNVDYVVDDFLCKETKKSPLGIMGLPEDIASIVSFLASKQARFITGALSQADDRMHVCSGFYLLGQTVGAI